MVTLISIDLINHVTHLFGKLLRKTWKEGSALDEPPFITMGDTAAP
jgi:hypothetical protein